jgi:hypothetical protein
VSKYRAKRCEIGGYSFASQMEGRRYLELKMLERAGKIWSLELQPKFPLVVMGKKVCTYIADFRYVEPASNGEPCEVVEDVKGVRTQAYIIKKRLFEILYGMPIREVRA